jgi:hypothetical protein
MTTERMEAYCLELNDQILIGNDVYRIYEIHDEQDEPDEILFYVVDEEGISHKIRVEDTEKLPVVIDFLSAIG